MHEPQLIEEPAARLHPTPATPSRGELLSAGAVASIAGTDFSPARVLALQRTAGNHAVAAMLARRPAAAPAATDARADPGAESDPVLIRFLEGLWQDDPVGMVRLGLEAVRPVPVLGLLTGLAADVLEGGQDFFAIPTGNAFLGSVTGVTVVARSLTNTANNGLGGLASCVQMIELFIGGATLAEGLSGLGLPATLVSGPLALTAAGLSEVITGAKIQTATLTFMLDFLVSLEAAAGAVLGPVEDSAGWSALMAGFLANQIGDVFGMLNDVIGLGTAGLSQSGVLSQVGKALITFLKVIIKAVEVINQWIDGFWNVVGGRLIGGVELPEPEEPVGLTPLARAADEEEPGAAGPGAAWYAARLAEADAVSGSIAQGDGIMGGLAEQVAELLEGAAAMAADATGGKEGAELLRENLASVLAEVESRVGLVGDVEVQAGSALEQLVDIGGGLDGAIEHLEALSMPEIEIPTAVDLGDGAVVDTIEAGIGAGADAAAGLIQAGLDEIGAALETAKAAALEPLQELRNTVTQLEEVLDAVLSAAGDMLAALTDAAVQVGAALARCETLPEMLQTVVDETVGLVSGGEVASLDELLASWSGLGPEAEAARARAQQGGAVGEEP